MKYVFTYKNGDKIHCDDDFVSVHSLEYDDIVDRSQFRPDSEQTRIFELTGSGSTGNPQYDTYDVSDIAVKIRSGKFDKAEVANIMRNRADEFKNENDKALKDKAQKELETISKARQDYLDKVTGFKGAPQEV